MLPTATAELGKILSNDPVNAEYRHLIVAARSRAEPGQFFQLLCPASGSDAPYLRRPMSVYGSAPERLEFLYKVTGSGTRGLATLQAGDTLDLFGPLGVGFDLRPEWRHIVAVGRGAGLATLAPLAQAASARHIGVTAILSARTQELVVSEEIFRSHGAQVVAVTDREGTSGPAHVERLMRGLIAERRCDAMFTCGSARILRVMQRLGHEHGIPGQVALEQQMACGLGMCFCCVREFNLAGEIVHKRVCWDGPVFDLQEAVP